jgi:hypothetical protein
MIRTMPRSKDALFLQAKSNGQTSKASLPIDFQDLCSRAMDRALGIEEASLSAVVDLNSCLFDIYKNSFSPTPAFGDLLETAARTFAFYTGLQMTWLGLILPYAKFGSEALSHFAEPGIFAAHSAVAGLERSVDAAMGRGKAA